MDPVTYHAHHMLRSEDMAYWRGTSLDLGGPVLELGSGTGRVMLRLAKENLEVVGIENDPNMLEFMQRSIPPKLSSLVNVYEVDMRAFDLQNQFPLVILPCNTLSTFDRQDRLKVFASAHRHMTSTGMFIFSVPNPLVLAELPQVGDSELEDEFTHPATNNPVEVYSRWSKDAGTITFEWRYLHHYSDHVVEEGHTTTHYLDPPQDYIREMKTAGLKAVAIHGDFHKARFQPESAYFIVEARKTEQGT